MDQDVPDLSPAEEWQMSLNSTCNRLSTQYLNLIRTTSSVVALETGQPDPRVGGGRMTSAQDPPPPPLAADVAVSSLQCQLAVENICVATSQLLGLIRTLRLSILLMDEDTIRAEEEWQAQQARVAANRSLQRAQRIEEELLLLRNNQASDDSLTN